MNPFISLTKILKPSPILILVCIYFLLFLGGNVHPVNWTLYTQTKFHWSAWQVGMSLSFVGIMIAISQGVLTRILIPKLGEDKSLSLGILIYAIAFALFSIASAGWMMYPIVVLFSVSGIAIPALQSMVAKHVPANEQGELQGSLVSLGSVATILAPILYTYLFVSFTATNSSIQFPGAAYAGAAIICLFAFILKFKQSKV